MNKNGETAALCWGYLFTAEVIDVARGIVRPIAIVGRESDVKPDGAAT